MDTEMEGLDPLDYSINKMQTGTSKDEWWQCCVTYWPTRAIYFGEGPTNDVAVRQALEEMRRDLGGTE